jgi:hypothetical protein
MHTLQAADFTIMNRLGTVISAIFAVVSCLWLALFILSWRDARRKPITQKLDATRMTLGILQDSPTRLSQERGVRFWLLFGFLVALNGIIIFLVWPVFALAWLSNRRKH